MDSLFSPWLILVPSAVVGAFLGIVFERTRGTAARRAAKFEADLVEARSELMRYRDQTKHHFGKSAELLGRMATDYREFLDHFVSGAEELCGPNMKEINASGLDRPMLGTSASAAAAPAPVAAVGAAPAPVATGGTAASPTPVTPPIANKPAPSPAAVVRPAAYVPPVATSQTAAAATPIANGPAARPPVAPAPAVHANGSGTAGVAMPPPAAREPIATEPFAEAK